MASRAFLRPRLLVPARTAVLALVVVVAGACSVGACTAQTAESPALAAADDPGEREGTSSSPSTAGEDGGGAPDATTKEDAAADARDTSAILGTLSGTCGALAALLGSPSPSLEQNQLTFVAGETYARASLSPGGQTIYDTPNAGGSSTESEVMSFEVLHYCEGASLVKTETQIKYGPPIDGGASITDILVSIAGRKIGVSVTRAYKPSSLVLTDADVKTILEKKLQGINVSSARVAPADKWDKQILHVFTATKAATDAVARVYPTIPPDVRADTVVLVTQTAGGGFVYCNPDPPLGSECP